MFRIKVSFQTHGARKMNKLDLVMWTKNGEKTLGPVLNRINHVIPRNNVEKRIIVDDASEDDTRRIARAHGWQVVDNEGSGISDGANTALKHVDSDHFISFEQDLLLVKDWWPKIPSHLEKPNVVVASGIRYSNNPYTQKLQEYTMERYKNWQSGLPSYLRSEARSRSAFMWGKTLDNTIYKTQVMQEIGGFPKLDAPAGVDPVLCYRLCKSGYEWVVDYNVVSTHLKSGLRNELRSQLFYGSCSDAISREIPYLQVRLFEQITRFLYSPLASLHVAFVKRCPYVLFAYPLIRLSFLRGIFSSRGASK